MDGLMFDSERLAAQLWQVAGEKIGREIPAELLGQIVGKTRAAAKKLFLERLGADFDFDKCMDLKLQIQREHYRKYGVTMKKGLPELLEYLKEQGIRMAVATSTERETAVLLLKKMKVQEYFDVLVFGDMVKNSKPAPDIFLVAANQLDLPIKECLVLEDSTAGVEAGKAAGGYIIHIPDLVKVPEEVKKGITAELTDLEQVISWLKEMEK